MANPVTKRESDILDEYAEIMQELNNPEDDENYDWMARRDRETNEEW
jgi:hypothetical protein